MPLPPETTLEEVRIKIKQAYQTRNNSIGIISDVVLKEGPRSYRIANLMEILDKTTGDFHHAQLKIDQIDRTSKKGWNPKPEKSVRLEGNDEIDRLYKFLHAYITGAIESESASELYVVKKDDYEKLSSILSALPSLPPPDKMELLKTLVNDLGSSNSKASDYISLLSGTNGAVVRNIASATRYIEYKEAYDHLNSLVEDQKTLESAFQTHLSKHSWMFGSEYSEILDRRRFGRDESLDYMMRRTSDGYLEIVEIKRAFSNDLFILDRSHNSYYPSGTLSKVVGQVINYIEMLEKSRDAIRADDGEDVLKIRAKIIIGRSGNKKQLSALRNYNDHLHGIEIQTYDQLLATSARILEICSGETVKATVFEDKGSDFDEIPF